MSFIFLIPRMKYTLLLVSVFAVALKAVRCTGNEPYDYAADDFNADGTTDPILEQSPELAALPDENVDYSSVDILNTAFIGNDSDSDDDYLSDWEYPEGLEIVPLDPSYDDLFSVSEDYDDISLDPRDTAFIASDSEDEYEDESFGLYEMFENQ